MRNKFAIALLAIGGLCLASIHAKAVDAAVAAKEIDTILAKDWADNKLEGNPPADDHTFVRRIYLDVVGRIPTARETEDFLGCPDAHKRAALIDKLLASEGYEQHAFNYWADVLRAQSIGLHSLGRTGWAYTAFIKQSLHENKPYDRLVRELITAQGAAWDNGAIGYYMRDRGMPLDNMATTVRIFLGTRIECAQCHDHPFDKWTQMDFYKMAAFTYGVKDPDYEQGSTLDTVREMMHQRGRDVFASFAKPVPPRRTQGMSDEEFAALGAKFEKETTEMEQRRSAAQQAVIREQRFYQGAFDYIIITAIRRTRVQFNPEAQLQLPHDYKYDDGKPNAEVAPAALYGAKADVLPGETRFDAYARWLTKDNARFDSVIADRLWKRAFGLSPIEPLDELLDTTKPMIPELQRRLEKLIVEVNYDMKAFLRVVYNTGVYQRQVTHGEVAAGTVYHFTGPILRRMSAEQMWDSFVTLINPRPDTPDETARETARQRVLQGKKMYDSLNALAPEVALRAIAAAGKKYEHIATEVGERQKRMVAVRAHSKELSDLAKKHPEDAGAKAAAAEATAKLDALSGELDALSHDARETVLTGVVIPAQKKLYEKATGKPFPTATPAADNNALPIVMGGDVMKDAALVERVPVPGYDTPELSAAQHQVQEASRRKQFEEEARYYGIKEEDLPAYFRSREEQGHNWLRASELRSPAPAGHYLREFGQSDRETIENANSEASIPQALALMNGQILPQILNRHSQLMLTVNKAPDVDTKVDAVYTALLSRKALPKEKALWQQAQGKGLFTIDDLIFSLLNTQQFIFVQ